MLNKKAFEKLYLELGETIKSPGIKRYSDKNKNNRKIKFRVFDFVNKEETFKNLVNKLNEVDGGGWTYECLTDSYSTRNNLQVFWDIKKYYN
jgi:L-rhamnose mutarotase